MTKNLSMQDRSCEPPYWFTLYKIHKKNNVREFASLEVLVSELNHNYELGNFLLDCDGSLEIEDEN